jgi:hypothetical protein
MITQAIRWQHDLAAAREQARTERKLVLTDLYKPT